jgi:YgiT-type zinc finger domain-containing protein
MKTFSSESECWICENAYLKSGQTTYTVDLSFTLVVVRNVPARVCTQCGEEWIAPDTARQLEEITEEARRKNHQVEVVAL